MSKENVKVYSVGIVIGNELIKHNRRLFGKFGVIAGKKFTARFRKTRLGRIDVLGINGHRVSRFTVFPHKFKNLLESSIGNHAKQLESGTERWDKLSRDERKENIDNLSGFGDIELGGMKVGIPILLLVGALLLSGSNKS